ncbi:MAG: hypothetical protein LBM75_11395 [Myxococcales bacterium]|jgi:hypothetical protein|nr:hypothetical protein [Myxococcales bacterium]
MDTLIDYYGSKKDELKEKINFTSSTKEIQEILQDEFKTLEDKCIKGLTKAQRQIAEKMLDGVRQSLDLLSFVELVSNDQAVENSQDSKKEKPWIKEGKWFSYSYKLEIFKEADDKTNTVPDSSYEVQFDSEKLLSYIEYSLEIIDDVVKEYNDVVKKYDALANQPAHVPELKDHRNVIEFLQSLHGESEQKQMDKISSLLFACGIRTRKFCSPRNDEQNQFFDFEPSLDPEAREYQQELPALISSKDGKLLLRGRVTEPADKYK